MQAYSPRSGSQVPPEKMEGPRCLYELGKDPSSPPPASGFSWSPWVCGNKTPISPFSSWQPFCAPDHLDLSLTVVLIGSRAPSSSVMSSQSLPYLSLQRSYLEVALTLEGHYINPLHRVSRPGAGSQLWRRQGKLGEIIMIRGGWSQSGSFWRKQLC